jgi:bifunctional non-homologous end joining protein LigD
VAEVRVHVDGRELRLSNLQKVLFPGPGTTKAAVVDYYSRIAPTMVGHLRDRAVTLVRYPDGVDGKSFFEKRCPPSAADWVRIGGRLHSCVVDDAATLVWLANLAALELHTHQHTVEHPDEPTAVVIDLDPGAPADILDCARVALELHEVLDRFGLRMVVKTSGSKGLHLSVPLNVPGHDDEETKRFALAAGQMLSDKEPAKVTVSMAKRDRVGRVFVDWSQNDRNKTTVAAYSIRAQPLPYVSTPVTWNEVTDALDGGDADALAFTIDDVLQRVDELGDLYEPNLTVEQELPSLQ